MTDDSDTATIALRVNDRECILQVDADDTLLDVLRNRLNLTSCRETCGLGLCGTCTVVVDGRAVSSCLMPAFPLDGAHVRTAEGLETGRALSPLQESFIENQAFQCSFCTPGFLMSATALLDEDPDGDVEQALAGHICRCGSYQQIVAAVRQAASGMSTTAQNDPTIEPKAAIEPKGKR